MLKNPITILVQAAVGGPGGKKLLPGKFYELDDSPYVRILLKSGQVVPVDPPSLDPEYLEKAGYELREGYSYEDLKKEVPKPEPKKKVIKLTKEAEEKPYLMSNEKAAKVSKKEDETPEEAPQEEPTPEAEEKPTIEEAKDHAPETKQLVPPVGMGVKKSEESK